MSSLIRKSWNLLPGTWPSLRVTSQNSIPYSNQVQPNKSLFTSPVLCYQTRKRRKRYPFFWLQDKYRAYYDEGLTPKNEEFFQQFLKNRYPINGTSSPLKSEPWNLNETFTEGSVRTGVVAKKLGILPMWTNKGSKRVTTCLQVSDNHVIKYHSPEEYATIGRPLDKSRYKGMGCIVVGADSHDPRVFTSEYNGLFEESGVMSKKKLTRFFITHNARIEPGTPLLASHFRPGMFVDVYGKGIEFGNQGARRRFKLKLGNSTHGASKSRNRIGSIGRGRRECGPLKGKKMQGVEGGERTIVPGLKVWRINTKYNLIYLQGPGIPGSPGDYINIMDSRLHLKKPSVESPPPFPTASVEENSQLDNELYASDLHNPSNPTLVFEITEEEKKAAALAARKFGKAKTAQKS